VNGSSLPQRLESFRCASKQAIIASPPAVVGDVVLDALPGIEARLNQH
jgi:hypothetical protein